MWQMLGFLNDAVDAQMSSLRARSEAIHLGYIVKRWIAASAKKPPRNDDVESEAL